MSTVPQCPYCGGNLGWTVERYIGLTEGDYPQVWLRCLKEDCTFRSPKVTMVESRRVLQGMATEKLIKAIEQIKSR